MTQERIIDRIRKLLALAEGRGATEAEAALAAERAAELMREHDLAEAEIRVSDDSVKAEPMVDGQGVPVAGTDTQRRRVAWKERIADAVARRFGCEVWTRGAATMLFGRVSHCQAASYTSAYLFREVDRLADDVYEDEARDYGHDARRWKSSFRMGCAIRLARRLYQLTEQERPAAPTPAATGTALMVVERDRAEVKAAFKTMTKGWGRASALRGGGQSSAGRTAGIKAADRINLSGGRTALGAGTAQIRGK